MRWRAREPSALGRKAVGTDVSSLAMFISRTKTTLFTERDLAGVCAWVDELPSNWNVRAPVEKVATTSETNYQSNINTRSTWRIQKLLHIALDHTKTLQNSHQRRLARSILLKTGQWAFDCRKEIPSVRRFRLQFFDIGHEIIRGAREYAQVVRSCTRQNNLPIPYRP